MSERTWISQKTQLGVEVTPGVAVAANKQLLGMSVEFEPQATVQDFTPLGSKYTSIVVEQREWMQAAMKGYPSFGDIVYLLSSIVSAPVVTQFMDGGTPTGAYKWVFDSLTGSEDSPKTFTIEQGSGVRAGRFPNALLRTMGLKFNRQTTDLTGQFIGKRVEDGVVLTPGPVAVPLQPLLASNFDCFIDPTSAAFGTTKLGRLFDGDLAFDNRFGAVWVVDSSQTSFAATVETKPRLEFKAILEADAAGMGYLNTLRAGSTVFGRIRNIGPMIYNAGIYVGSPLNYQFTADLAMKVKAIGKFSDQEGVYAIEFTFEGVNDDTWGHAIHFEVVNNLSAL